MGILVNDPPPTLADSGRKMWFFQLDRRHAAVVIERTPGQFTPRATHFSTHVSQARQGMPRTTFRDAAEDALRIAGQQGAFVEPMQWPYYFRD
jgi:hypothetical protein